MLQIIGRIDEMGSRIDDLEKSIGELMEQVTKLFQKNQSTISRLNFYGVSRLGSKHLQHLPLHHLNCAVNNRYRDFAVTLSLSHWA